MSIETVLSRVGKKYREYLRPYLKERTINHGGRKVSIVVVVQFSQIVFYWSLLVHYAWINRLPIYWNDIDSPEISRYLYKKLSPQSIRTIFRSDNELKAYSPPTDIDRIKIFFT